MNGNTFSVSRILRILGALILDAVMVIIFVKKYFWFTLLAPAESVLMMLVLITGLAVVDWVIIAPPSHKKFGVGYAAAISVLLVLYAVSANIVSILTIWPCKLIWYVVWQLLILGVFILVIAVIASFGKRAAQDIEAGSAERALRGNVTLLLADMQNNACRACGRSCRRTGRRRVPRPERAYQRLDAIRAHSGQPGRGGIWNTGLWVI
jgi:hypothetical protein